MNRADIYLKLTVQLVDVHVSINLQHAKILWLLCIGIICYAVFYIANIYLLRSISIANYGNFAVSIKVLAILCALLTIAKQFSLTTYLPQYEKSHKFIQRNGLVLWLSKNLILSAIVLSVGITITWGIFYLLENEAFMQTFQDSPFHFVLFFLPILTFFVVLSCLGLSQPTLNSIVASFITILPNILVISVFVLGLYTLNTSTMSTILLYFSTQAVVLVLYLFLSKTQYEPQFAKGYSVGEHEQWYTNSSAYWMSTFANQLGVVLSLFALEFLAPEAFVGQYAIILLFVVSFNALISPLHTYLSSQMGILLGVHTGKLKSLLRMINRIQLVIIMIGFISSIVFGKQLLQYISVDEQHLYPSLVLAMLFFGLSITTASPLRVLLHSHYRNAASVLKLFRLIGCCLLLSVLVPKYGIAGAIISDTLPMIITNIVGAYLCNKQLHINALMIK